MTAPSDGFWRGLSGEGRSVLEGSASIGENLGLTVNGLVTGPVRAAYGLAGEIGNQYADAYNLLTRDGTSYVPSSALASNLERNGIGSTLASMGESVLSSQSKPIFDLLEGNYRTAGEGLLGTAAMGMGVVRGVGAGALADLPGVSSLEGVAPARMGWPGRGGAGPVPGTIGITDSSSVAALQNYYPKGGGVEFVYDPATNQFAAGSPMRGLFDGTSRTTSPINWVCEGKLGARGRNLPARAKRRVLHH